MLGQDFIDTIYPCVSHAGIHQLRLSVAIFIPESEIPEAKVSRILTGQQTTPGLRCDRRDGALYFAVDSLIHKHAQGVQLIFPLIHEIRI